jgi:hypothetical protein
MADVLVVGQVALHHQVVLAGDRINLRDLLDALHGLVGDLIGLAELALHHDEDRLHGGPLR